MLFSFQESLIRIRRFSKGKSPKMIKFSVTYLFIITIIVSNKIVLNSALTEPEVNSSQKSLNKMVTPQKRVVPLISNLKEFEENLPGYLDGSKTIAIMLDYDGTLSPLGPNPNDSKMPEEIEATLKELANHPRVFMAVISGRGIIDVQNKIGIQNITYGGNHGIEIQNSDGTRSDYQLPEEIQINYKKLVDDLKRQIAKNGAWVEDKRVSLTYHYRNTPKEFVEEQRDAAIKIIGSYGFKANPAHSAIEAKPPVNWNKGEASLYILKKNFGDNWHEKVNVVFAGDDTTDEDAMKVIQGYGKSFRISSDPKVETYADFRLPSQPVVADLLKWLATVYK